MLTKAVIVLIKEGTLITYLIPSTETHLLWLSHVSTMYKVQSWPLKIVVRF